MSVLVDNSDCGEAGVITRGGSRVACSDSSVVIYANPYYGYFFEGWSNSNVSNPDTLFLTVDSLVTAHFSKCMYSVSVVSTDTLRGMAICDGSTFYQDSVTLTATANYGYHFAQWSDGNTDNPRQVQVTRDSVFTALFDYNQYSIALAVDTVIHGTVSGAGSYNYLSSRTLTAVANYGYHFMQWSDGVTDNPRTIVLTRDTAFTAQFENNVYSIVVQSADSTKGGVEASAAELPYLDNVTLEATASYGYHFAQWSDGSTENPRTVQVVSDSVIVAYFEPNQYRISLAVDAAERGTTSGEGEYDYMSSNTIAATASYGYHFTQWSDGVTDNPRTVTLTQDTAFTALFDKNSYTLTLASNDTTLGVVSGGSTVEYLDTVSIAATVVAGHHHFVSWSDGSRAASRAVVVTSDSLITAFFAIDSHSVTLQADDASHGTVNGSCEVPYGAAVVVEAVAADGYHFAQWSNGSRMNPDTITVVGDTALTAVFTDDVVPQIYMVSVQDGRNTVVWNKSLPVTAYNIYREGSVTGEYELAATIPYDAYAEWVDTASRPSSRSYRYRMTATDVYGYESEPGTVHKTMHLTISKGIGNRWNLVWTEYEGASYSTYIIYRGTNASDMQQIDVMAAGGNTTYTDEDAPEGEVFYQVGVVMQVAPTYAKASYTSLSNIATNGMTGIRAVADNGASVSVEDGRIRVEGTDGLKVAVYDAAGRLLASRCDEMGVLYFEVPAAGTYLVRVGNSPAKRVVVVR